MKKFITLFSFLLLLGIAADAQVKLPKNSVNAGKLITQFTNALKPSSFTDAFKSGKGDFVSKAQKVSSAVSMAQTISSLAGFVKPGLFKEGSSAQSIMAAANSVKTMTDAAGLLKTFEGGLKPEAFLSSWTGQRSGWLKALNLLK